MGCISGSSDLGRLQSGLHVMPTSRAASALTLLVTTSNDVSWLAFTFPSPSPLAVALLPSMTVTVNGLPVKLRPIVLVHRIIISNLIFI